MAKRGRHPHKSKQRKRPPQARAHARRSEPDDLMGDVRRRLASGDPLEFLAFASTLLNALDPRGENPFERGRSDKLTLSEFVESLAREPTPETTALLTAFAELVPDELTRARVRREVGTRHFPLPDWLSRLGETSVYQVLEGTHVLGDGDNVMLGVRLPGHELTVVIYIDHNMGTVVKDAFPVQAPLEEVSAQFQAASDDPDLTVQEISFADARARAEEAIEKGAIMFPPFDTDTWPGSRPMVEWLLRLLPSGGVGYVRPEWSEAAQAELAERFFASDFGSALEGAGVVGGDEDHRGLLGNLLWFGTDYGPGDPMRWSVVAVEILMTDWIPRKIVAPAEYLAKAPEVLRAFIRFCHAERGIRADLTSGTLAAVDEYEAEYQRVIRSDRPQGPEALLAAMGVLGDDES
jgi:hypothetical protein